MNQNMNPVGMLCDFVRPLNIPFLRDSASIAAPGLTSGPIDISCLRHLYPTKKPGEMTGSSLLPVHIIGLKSPLEGGWAVIGGNLVRLSKKFL